MNTPMLSSLIVLWFAIGIIAAAGLLAGIRLLRDNRQLQKRLDDVSVQYRGLRASLRKERDAARARTDTLAKRHAALDRKLLALESRQHRVEQQTGGGHPYERALRMAGRGASVEELEAVGLSRGEAELALRMHGLALG